MKKGLKSGRLPLRPVGEQVSHQDLVLGVTRAGREGEGSLT